MTARHMTRSPQASRAGAEMPPLRRGPATGTVTSVTRKPIFPAAGTAASQQFHRANLKFKLECRHTDRLGESTHPVTGPAPGRVGRGHQQIELLSFYYYTYFFCKIIEIIARQTQHYFPLFYHYSTIIVHYSTIIFTIISYYCKYNI